MEAKQGKQVKILGVGRPTIKKYVPGTPIDNVEEPEDNSIYLNIDQYDYFNYGVDNIDKAQSKEGLMEALHDVHGECVHAAPKLTKANA